MSITVFRKPTASAGGYNTIEEEGVAQTQRTAINFVGAGVTASDVGGKTQVSIPGGAGTFAITQATVTLPYPASRRHVVNVVDAAMAATDKVLVSLAGVAETQVNASDSIMPLAMQALPKAGSFDLQIAFLYPAAGPLVINYTRST